jgi:hypothetical protein
MGAIMRIVQKVSQIIAILISADIAVGTIGIIRNYNKRDSRLHDLAINNKYGLRFLDNESCELFNHCRMVFPVE